MINDRNCITIREIKRTPDTMKAAAILVILPLFLNFAQDLDIMHVIIASSLMTIFVWSNANLSEFLLQFLVKFKHTVAFNIPIFII